MGVSLCWRKGPASSWAHVVTLSLTVSLVQQGNGGSGRAGGGKGAVTAGETGGWWEGTAAGG